MSNKKKGGFINRLIMGSEKSEGYARASLPSNRWELFWDIFKGSFWKLVLLNILMLLFFIPFFMFLILKTMASASFGALIPYSQGFGVGYQAYYSLVGFSETSAVNSSFLLNLILPLAMVIMAVGMSGGAYVMRNMVWTEGIFVSNDFWRGIKQNAKQLILFYLVASVFLYMSLLSIDMCEQLIVNKTGAVWLFQIARVFSYAFIVLIINMLLHGTAMCVTYELSFKGLIKNSFLFTIGMIPQNFFFMFLGGLPIVLILFGGTIQIIGYTILAFFGLSLFMLVWTDFCQWSYDRFINDKVKGAKKNRGIYEKVKNSDSKSLKQYREQMAMTGRSSLSDKPIKPITDDELKVAELPTSFNRADIAKLNESKQAIYEDNEKYIAEHKNDPEYKPTEEDIENKKILEEREKRIEKAKQELMKRKKK